MGCDVVWKVTTFLSIHLYCKLEFVCVNFLPPKLTLYILIASLRICLLMFVGHFLFASYWSFWSLLFVNYSESKHANKYLVWQYCRLLLSQNCWFSLSDCYLFKQFMTYLVKAWLFKTQAVRVSLMPSEDNDLTFVFMFQFWSLLSPLWCTEHVWFRSRSVLL